MMHIVRVMSLAVWKSSVLIGNNHRAGDVRVNATNWLVRGADTIEKTFNGLLSWETESGVYIGQVNNIFPRDLMVTDRLQRRQINIFFLINNEAFVLVNVICRESSIGRAIFPAALSARAGWIGVSGRVPVTDNIALNCLYPHRDVGIQKTKAGRGDFKSRLHHQRGHVVPGAARPAAPMIFW